VEERFRDMWWVIARDAGMLLLVGQSLWADRDAGERRDPMEGDRQAEN